VIATEDSKSAKISFFILFCLWLKTKYMNFL
jgi:hypothetical protein